MKELIKIVLSAVVIASIPWGELSAAAGVVVVGNKGIPVDNLTPEQAKKLWLGKTKKLHGAGKVFIIDQRKGSPARDEFYIKVIGKDAGQVKAYWLKIIFTGKGYPPKELDNDAAVLKWVAETPGGLGYVDSSVVNESVKILLTTQ